MAYRTLNIVRLVHGLRKATELAEGAASVVNEELMSRGVQYRLQVLEELVFGVDPM
ncbi:hypothetical protein SVAN01_10441 [Stagonosporopsis vannaccii]|nr:hypothetical protein SVAN01_10441 [Stagonosporopsis vannaccii]